MRPVRHELHSVDLLPGLLVWPCGFLVMEAAL
jgi:hypothetical protein